MRVDILGRSWKISTLEPETFIKRFEQEYAGITLPTTREIFINTDELNLGTVIHEVTHAFLASLCLQSADLTVDQHEEVYCEVMAIHGANLGRMARKIYEALR